MFQSLIQILDIIIVSFVRAKVQSALDPVFAEP